MGLRPCSRAAHEPDINVGSRHINIIQETVVKINNPGGLAVDVWIGQVGRVIRVGRGGPDRLGKW